MHLKYEKVVENLQKISNVEFGLGDDQETDMNSIQHLYVHNSGEKRKKPRILLIYVKKSRLFLMIFCKKIIEKWSKKSKNVEILVFHPKVSQEHIQSHRGSRELCKLRQGVFFALYLGRQGVFFALYISYEDFKAKKTPDLSVFKAKKTPDFTFPLPVARDDPIWVPRT